MPEPSDIGAHADFQCSLCDKSAGTVELLLPIHREALSKSQTIFINGFIGNERVVLSDDQAHAVKAALQRADPLALYQVDKLFAPFYCPNCVRVYCLQHWTIIPVYDGDFFDCSYGYCPENHKRLIED